MLTHSPNHSLLVDDSNNSNDSNDYDKTTAMIARNYSKDNNNSNVNDDSNHNDINSKSFILEVTLKSPRLPSSLLLGKSTNEVKV